MPPKPDSILFWNAVALEANRVSHTDPGRRQQNGPTLSSRALAIVHLAMYDAYAGIAASTDFPRYLTGASAPAPMGASARDAVAGAAHKTLSTLFSLQSEFIDAQRSAFNQDDPSYAFGQNVGQALLDLRANDMDGRDGGYLPSNKRGRHRRDPDNPSQGFHAPFYGAQTRTFAVKTRHSLKPPPFDNAKYLQALQQVRAKGIRPDLTATLPDDLFPRRRSAEDTLVGIYWGYDGASRLGTPPRFYNQIIREVAMRVKNTAKRINDEGDNARLFAFVNAAMGDAGVLAWEQKYCHDFWRPVVGIREHDEDFGPAAPHAGVHPRREDGDPGWLPLGAPSTNSTGMKNFTPDFPAYPSGHATFGAAAFHMTRMFYGIKPDDKKDDKLLLKDAEGKDLFFVSDEYNGINRDNDGTVRPRHTRRFAGGLWEMIMENALSRIFLGVHWIFDAFDFKERNGELTPNLNDEEIGGVGLGLRIARDIYAHGNKKAPQMTPAGEKPPIETPPAMPPAAMPTMPKQPSSVKGCAEARDVKANKGAAPEAAWPEGIAEQEGRTPSPIQQAWPSGISEK
jgi:Vanadium chloroperoxidase N-terminal domain/PAP2 superfamily